MFRRFVIAAAVATLTVLSPSALLGQEAPPAPGATHKQMMMPKPVNLKVLPKDTSPDQLMKIMHGYSQALGVQCTFCHSQEAGAKFPNFASDAKPEKSTADPGSWRRGMDGTPSGSRSQQGRANGT